MKRIYSFIKLLFAVALMVGVFSSMASIGGFDPLESLYIGSFISVGCIAYMAFLKPSKNRKNLISNDFTEALCLLVQTSLNNVMGTNDPTQRRTPIGYLQAVTSPYNRSGFNQEPLVDRNGKIHSVKVIGIQMGCEDDISEECTALEDRTCIGDKVVAPWEDTISNFACIESPAFLFQTSDMKKLCDFGTDDAYRARVINAYIDPMMRKLNKAMITAQNSNFGNFFNGSAGSQNVELLNANGTPNYLGEAQILNFLEDIGVTSKPIVIGSGKLSDYIRQVGIGCCNDGGVNLAQAGNLDYYRDKYVEGILGADQFIALQPGMVQLVTKNDNVGQYVRNEPSYINNTFIDPYTGIEIDMDVIYEPCKKHYFMQFRFNWMMYFMSQKARASCDELYGVNGSLLFKATQGS